MAYLGDRPIGYCWTRTLVEKQTASESMKGEIHMLGVDPEFRKQGVGRNVLLAGLSHLKDKGITIIELTTDGEDPAASRLYESVGFQEMMISEWYEKNLV
jgi:mycothiol synthase